MDYKNLSDHKRSIHKPEFYSSLIAINIEKYKDNPFFAVITKSLITDNEAEFTKLFIDVIKENDIPFEINDENDRNEFYKIVDDVYNYKQYSKDGWIFLRTESYANKRRCVKHLKTNEDVEVEVI